MQAVALGCLVLCAAVFCPSLLRAQEVDQDLGIFFEYNLQHTPNDRCPENYFYQLVLHWSAPPEGSICFYQVYKDGVSLGTTGGTSYALFSTSGCFGSYENFMGSVNGNLEQGYYNSSFKVVAIRNCFGLPNIADQITIADKESLEEASRPILSEQTPREDRTTVGEPINVATGHMFMDETDIWIPAREVPLELSRTYNSQDDFDGQFGHGWRSNFDVRLREFIDRTVVEEGVKGVSTVYSWSAVDASYVPSAGKHSSLTRNPDFTYTVMRKGGQKFEFDAQGRLLRVDGRNGNAVSISRGAWGAISEVEGPGGRKLLFTQDAQGRTTQISGPAGRIWQYEYDTDGDLVRTVDPMGNAMTYEYDAGHRITKRTDAGGHALHFEYDASGRATHSWQDGMDNEVTLSFDSGGQVTDVTDSRGNVTRYEFNEYGLVTKVTDALGNIRQDTWDAGLNRTLALDENGRATTFSYDGRGNLLSAAGPLNSAVTFTYEPIFDLVTTVTDALGNVTAYGYDPKGNLIRLTDATGNISTNIYDGLGQLTSTTNPLGGTMVFVYDAYGNLLETTDALGLTASVSYDMTGNPVSVKDAKDNTTAFVYDDLSRPTRVTYADSSTVSYAYDVLGNRTSVTDNASNTTAYTYDQNGRVTSTTDPLGHSVAFSYDTEGNLVRVTDQKSQETNYQYDPMDRLVSETDALGSTRTYTYDPVGNRTSAVDAKGSTIAYEYDDLDRLQGIVNPDGSVAFTYDVLGRRIAMNDGQGVTSYAYDPLGRLTQVQGPGVDSMLRYTYDALGNRTGLTLPDGKTVQYAHDILGRLVSITGPDGKVTAYAYDEAGNLMSSVQPNDTQTTYTYDPLYRLTHIINHKQSDPLEKLSEFDYAYDAAGRRVLVTQLDGAINYTYDAAGRLLSESKGGGSSAFQRSYEYDPAGNRTRMMRDGLEYLYVYDNANRLLQEDVAPPAAKSIVVAGTVTDINGVASVTVNGIPASLDGDDFSCEVELVPGLNTLSVVAIDAAGNTTTETRSVTYAGQSDQVVYQYDANGNLISRQSSAQTLSFGFDHESRLTSVASGGFNVSYGYDGDGKRVFSDDGSAVTRYLYDGTDVLWERNGAGDLVTSYLRHPYAAGGIGGIIRAQQGGTETYYSYDGLGSVSNLSDASGNGIHANSYDAFGNLLSSAQPGVSHQFLTKEAGPFGIIYFWARFYDPRIGRFLTPDPSGMADGPNLYLYCLNDPVNCLDFYGLWKVKTRSLANPLFSLLAEGFVYSVNPESGMHWQIFFDDGTNIGYMGDDKKDKSRPKFDSENSKKYGRQILAAGSDDEAMKEAVGIAIAYWEVEYQKGQRFHYPALDNKRKFDCQQFVLFAVQEYGSILRERTEELCQKN